MNNIREEKIINDTSLQTQNATDLESKFQDIFGSSSFTDDDLIKTVERHTLQLSSQQIKSILWLRSFNNIYINELTDTYLEVKHHNNSAELIIGALNAISLRKFISQFKFNINQNK
jgi:hypothetical protein